LPLGDGEEGGSQIYEICFNPVISSDRDNFITHLNAFPVVLEG
jgi:hypothetical protein